MNNNINITAKNTIGRKTDIINNADVVPLGYAVDKHREILSKCIYIDGGNRDIDYFPSPYNFIVYIGTNHHVIVNNKTICVEPRIQRQIPNMDTINLTKIIIPLFTMIKQTVLTINADISAISDYFISNSSSISIDESHLIPGINMSNVNSICTNQNGIVTIVNKTATKINFIINYDTTYVYSFIFKNNVLTNAYFYNIDKNFNSKKERILHLIIKELDDEYDHSTNSSIISTFKLFPKSLKNKFLFASTLNVKKIYEKQPRKLNRITCILADANNNEIKIYFLDMDVPSKSNKCYCSFESKKYSCPCNYILHPYNRYYQMSIFLNFTYKQLIYEAEKILY